MGYNFNGWYLLWLVIIVLGGNAGLKMLIKKMILLVSNGDENLENGRAKRAKTLGGIFLTIGRTVIAVVALFMLLSAFGIDTTPLLAASGIIGVAIGLGSQSLAKDFVSGILILAENQYAVGDRVKLGDVEGTIERMTVRSTVIRDNEGNLVFLPNGGIGNVVNYSLRNK